MNINLKILKAKDVTKAYVNWFSNLVTVKYSDNQYRKFTIKSQIHYVNECHKNKNLLLYGIFVNKIHIGNVLISGLLSKHRRVEISYVIGEKDYLNKGIGTEVIKKIILICKIKYKLNKIFAGCADRNISSRKVLEKNKFTLEGVRKKHLFYNGMWNDQLDYGLLLDKIKIN